MDMVILGGNAYRLHNGTLLQSPVLAGGVVEGVLDPEQWCQVESFELEPETQLQIDRAFTALLGLRHEHGQRFSHVSYLNGHGLVPA